MKAETRAPNVPTFSAVVATLRRPERIERVLDALVACQPPFLEVVVVDGDAEESARPPTEKVRERSDTVIRYITSPPGLTRQRNKALAVASGDVVVFVDDDAHVPPDSVAGLTTAYGDPSVVGATGRIMEPGDARVGGKESALRRLLPGGGVEGTFTRFGYPRRLTRPEIARDVEFMQGCFMTARTDAAREVTFDENLAGYGLAEDEDFSYRLSRLGRIRYLPDLVVHHDNTGYGTRDRRAFGRQVVANRLYLFRKNFPQTRLARIQFALLLLVLLAHRAANGDWRGMQGLVEGIIEAYRR